MKKKYWIINIIIAVIVLAGITIFFVTNSKLQASDYDQDSPLSYLKDEYTSYEELQEAYSYETLLEKITDYKQYVMRYYLTYRVIDEKKCTKLEIPAISVTLKDKDVYIANIDCFPKDADTSMSVFPVLDSEKKIYNTKVKYKYDDNSEEFYVSFKYDSDLYEITYYGTDCEEAVFELVDALLK